MRVNGGNLDNSAAGVERNPGIMVMIQTGTAGYRQSSSDPGEVRDSVGLVLPFQAPGTIHTERLPDSQGSAAAVTRLPNRQALLQIGNQRGEVSFVPFVSPGGNTETPPGLRSSPKINTHKLQIHKMTVTLCMLLYLPLD